MKNSMTFEVLPLGLCVACLEAMVDPTRGAPAFHQDLGKGRALWGIYCNHNQTGAFTLVSPNQDAQWTMITPTDIELFLQLVKKTGDDVARQLSKKADG